MTATSLGARDQRLYYLSTEMPSPGPDVVGAKAAGLMQMASAGLPVPPGFVLPVNMCGDYFARGGHLGDDVITLVTQGVRQLERQTQLRLGGRRRPLLVAVRSGSAVSMPGMLDTILNIGLCDGTLPALLRASGDPRFAWDSYRRLVESYAEVAEGCQSAPFAEVVSEALRSKAVPGVGELDAAALRGVVGQLHGVYASEVGQRFPQDPLQQLLGAIEAVMRSWNSPRAREYRRLKQLTGLTGTAVTVQAMVFGNMGMTSGAGVGFTRDPATGQHQLYVDFLLDAQGEDVVSGRVAAGEPDTLIGAIPGLAAGLQEASRKLEAIFADAQDFEFTVEDGKLWLLQARTAKRTPWAALQIACDLVDEGLIEPASACERLLAYDLDKISRARLSPGLDVQPAGFGTPSSTGVASGRIALTIEAAQQWAERDEPAILVRPQAATEDIAALALCRGLLTAAGARTSHAAVVARELGVVCLVGCPTLTFGPAAGDVRIGDWRGSSGDVITIDGESGTIYPGALPLVEERPADLIAKVRTWEDERPR